MGLAGFFKCYLMEMLVQMVMSQCFVCREGEVILTSIYSYVCVCAPFEFSVSTVYVNGHVGLSGVVVALTECPECTC